MMNVEQNADAGVGSSIPMPSYAYYPYNTINVPQLLQSAKYSICYCQAIDFILIGRRTKMFTDLNTNWRKLVNHEYTLQIKP